MHSTEEKCRLRLRCTESAATARLRATFASIVARGAGAIVVAPGPLFLSAAIRSWALRTRPLVDWAISRPAGLFYCNGHSWLARQLAAENIAFTAANNAFVHIDDWARAQALA